MPLKTKHGFFARIDERLARLAVIEKHYLHQAMPYLVGVWNHR